MENNPELLQEVRRFFEANDVEVIMVNEPTFTYDGKEYDTTTFRCGEEYYYKDIANFVIDKKVTKIGLYQACEITISGDGENVSFRMAVINE